MSHKILSLFKQELISVENFDEYTLSGQTYKICGSTFGILEKKGDYTNLFVAPWENLPYPDTNYPSIEIAKEIVKVGYLTSKNKLSLESLSLTYATHPAKILNMFDAQKYQHALLPVIAKNTGWVKQPYDAIVNHARDIKNRSLKVEDEIKIRIRFDFSFKKLSISNISRKYYYPDFIIKNILFKIKKIKPTPSYVNNLA